MDDESLAALYPNEAGSVPDAAADMQTPAAGEVTQATGADALPERYELKLEGVHLDPKLVSEAEPIFREMGLSNKQANALLPIAPKLIASAEEAVMQRLIDGGATQRKAWLDAFANDREIGGANRAESTRLAQKGMEVMGFGADHPFRRALNDTGFGNHPDMIRILRRIGATSGGSGAGARALASRLYPND